MSPTLIAELDALIAANATKPLSGHSGWEPWEVEVLSKYRDLPLGVIALKLNRSMPSVENKRRREKVEWQRAEKKI